MPIQNTKQVMYTPQKTGLRMPATPMPHRIWYNQPPRNPTNARTASTAMTIQNSSPARCMESMTIRFISS